MPKRIASIADLTPDSQNANRGTERGRGMLEASLRKYGAGRSVLADKHGTLIAGNKTVEAASEIDLPIREVHTDGRELVVVVRDDLDLGTDKAARELAYADNRVSQVSLEWELAQIGADVEAGIDLSAMFTTDELAALLAQDAGPTEGLTDPDAVPSVPDEPITKPGDLWVLGRHRLLCGDSTNPQHMARLLDAADVHMVWSDPPYGTNAVDNSPRLQELGYRQIAGDSTTQVATDTFALCAPLDAVQVWWGANYYADHLPPSPSWIVWDKDHHGMDFADAELAWVNSPRPVRCFRHAWSGADRDSERGTKRVHPNQKPVALALWGLEQFGAGVTAIYDPFAGSGIGIIAAEITARSCYAMELDPAYCDVIVNRWGAFTGGQAVRLAE